MLTWVLVAVALIGTVLNVLQERSGFLFWMVSNLGLATVNFRRRQWAQGVLFAVYLGLAVWGWSAWEWKMVR